MVAIYGTGKETVAEVVGDLLRKRGLTIGVVDTLTDGQIVREFEENGAGDVVVAHGDTDIGEQEDPRALTEAMAQTAAPEGGVGLAMVGPYDGGATFMAVYGSDPTSANMYCKSPLSGFRSHPPMVGDSGAGSGAPRSVGRVGFASGLSALSNRFLA